MANLGYGSSGNDVKALQQALIAAGYDVGSTGADGIIGAKTQAAIQQYQRDKGLSVDGIAGTQTQGSLRSNGYYDTQPAQQTTQQQSYAAPTASTAAQTANLGISIPSYEEYLDKSGYEDFKKQVTDAVKAQTQQAVDAYEAQMQEEEKNQQEAARQAYIAKMQSQRNLDQQISAAGYAGGMADSQRMAVENQYLNNLGDIEEQKADNLAALRRAIAQAELQGDSDLNGYLADYQQQVGNSYRGYAADAQQAAYNQVMGYLERGIMPSDADLAVAGIDKVTASVIAGQNRKTAGGGGNGGTGGTGAGYDNQGVPESTIRAIQNSLGVTADGKWGAETQAAYESQGGTGGAKDAANTYYDYVRAQKTGYNGYYYGG